MGQKTCIGTTDDQVSRPNVGVTIAIETLFENANRLLDLSKPLTKEDIISERCGVRPLVIREKDRAGRLG